MIGECQLFTTADELEADELEARLVAVRQKCCVSYSSSESQNTRDIKPATELMYMHSKLNDLRSLCYLILVMIAI